MKQAKEWMYNDLSLFTDAESALAYYRDILDYDGEDGYLEQDVATATFAINHKADVFAWYEDMASIENDN